MSIFFWIIGFVLLLAFLDWLRMKIRNQKYLIGIPGPQYLPLLGNLLDFPSVKDVFAVGVKYNLIYGKMFRMNVSLLDFLVVLDPNWIQKILNSQQFLAKSREYRCLHPWLGQGLLTSTGEKWRKSRKFLTPAFHFNNLHQFSGKFNAISDTLIEKLKAEVGKPSTEMFHHLTLCTLDIICESTLGISVDAQNEEDSDYVKSVEFMKSVIYRRTFKPWKMVDFLYMLSSDYRTERKALKILHQRTDEVIRKRRDFLLSTNDYQNNPEKCTTFLDMLLQGSIDGKPLTDIEIREQVDTFMFEGHDTTASAICFTLMLLCRYTECQDKIVDEIRSVVGPGKDLNLSYQNLQDMKYLNLVFKEALRLFPSVPNIARTLDEDVECNGVLLPKGLTVLIPIMLVQRSWEDFENAEKFVPERFSEENTVQYDPYVYTPFSAGFRNCIGQKFALLELKTVLAKILVNFKLTATNSEAPQVYPDIILKLVDGLHVHLELRE